MHKATVVRASLIALLMIGAGSPGVGTATAGASASTAILLVGAADSTRMLEAVSNRADLVSGGDVLVRVRPPASNAATDGGTLSLNGTPLAEALHPAPDGDGMLALVTGLQVGSNNTVAFASGGRTATLVVTDYPIGGPIFSGPHLQPWVCTSQNNGLGAPMDADCNAPTSYTIFYKKTGTAPPEFAAYDAATPPPAAEIATTTTDQGVTVPYIVRVETGTITDRSTRSRCFSIRQSRQP